MGERARRTARRVFLSLLWIAAGYYFFFGGEYSFLEIRDLRAERDSLAARVDSLAQEADLLAERARRLDEDSFVIEKTARERYGFIRDGERLYRFMDVAAEGEDGGGVDGERGDG